MLIDVTAAVIRDGDKILLARRAAGEHLEQMWELPGGKIEPGETPEACLQRELYEEFGIETEVGRYLTESCYDYKEKHIRLLAYEVKHIGGEFTLTVHDKIAWVTSDEIPKYAIAPADIPIVDYLIVNP